MRASPTRGAALGASCSVYFEDGRRIRRALEPIQTASFERSEGLVLTARGRDAAALVAAQRYRRASAEEATLLARRCPLTSGQTNSRLGADPAFRTV